MGFEVRFPFKKIVLSPQVSIFRPVASVLVKDKKGKWQPVEMLVDTGADFTLFPKRYAFALGIDLEKDCRVKKTSGVGGRERVYIFKNLEMMVGEWKGKVACGFLGRDNIPPLLGRDAFEKLRTIFVNRLTIFDNKTKEKRFFCWRWWGS